MTTYTRAREAYESRECPACQDGLDEADRPTTLADVADCIRRALQGVDAQMELKRALAYIQDIQREAANG